MTKSLSNTAGSESADVEIANSWGVYLLYGVSKIR